MNYISHVFHYPPGHPFDQPELRWPSFVGEFVRPIVVARPELLFWFTHYDDHSKLRLFMDDYESLRGELEALRDNLSLKDKGEEKKLTLVDDLGGGRFISPNSVSTPSQRSEFILRSLCATARLVVDSVVKRLDGYWQFEENKDSLQNPDDSHLFSVVHLFHNMCSSDAFVRLFQHDGKPLVMSHYYFMNAANSQQIDPTGSKGFRVKM